MLRRKIQGRTLHGAAVELSALPVDDVAGSWNTLCYEVGMASGVKITKADLESCVRNFASYPKVPLVIEHADTEVFGATEWAAPRGWVTDLRLGTFKRSGGKVVASLEGRIQTDDATRDAINGVKGPDGAVVKPPTWPFGSVTLCKAKDEETGTELGLCLWSFSLTAHPRLTDVPRLAASRGSVSPDRLQAGHYWGTIEDRDDLVEALRRIFELPALASESEVLAQLDRFEKLSADGAEAEGVDLDELTCALREALRLPVLSTLAEVIAEVRKGLAMPAETMSRGTAARSEETTMKWLEMAVKFGLAAANEEDAREKVLAHLHAAGDIVTALGARTPAEAAAKLSVLQAEAAKVDALTKERDGLRKESEDRLDAERAAHVTDVMAAQFGGLPEDRAGALRRSLELHAKQDWKGFCKEFPRPSRAEVSQRIQDPARFSRVTTPSARTPAGTDTGPSSQDLISGAEALIDQHAQRGQRLTFSEALEMLGDVVSADTDPEAPDAAAAE